MYGMRDYKIFKYKWSADLKVMEQDPPGGGEMSWNGNYERAMRITNIVAEFREIADAHIREKCKYLKDFKIEEVTEEKIDAVIIAFNY